jgi:hypothetical protein
MIFDNTKKKILTVKLISCIIINILKLREIHSKISSSNLIDKFTLLKDLSKFSYDILTFNIVSLLCSFFPLYKRIKLKISKIINKNKNK